MLALKKKKTNFTEILLIFISGRRDLLSALVSAGCCHLAIKILNYLDSASLLSASLVCQDWQHYLLNWFYAVPRFRQKIHQTIFNDYPLQTTNHVTSSPKSTIKANQVSASMSKITFSLALARSAIIDVTVDDDLNLFALALLSGRPHVMSCSLFTRVRSISTPLFSKMLISTKSYFHKHYSLD